MRVLVPGIVVLLLTSVHSAQRPSAAPGELLGVVLLDGNQSIQMKYTIASRRSHTGITSSTQYFVFGGPRAALRSITRTPAFEFETDPGFEDPVYLFKFDAHTTSREIRVAKGSGGLAELSIPKDHIIQTSLKEIGDGTISTKRYRLKPTSALRPGEYCLGRSSYSCFDFGVD